MKKVDVKPIRDPTKQLLPRSRYFIFKDKTNWTPHQEHRAEVLSEAYPFLKQAYDLSRSLVRIFIRSK